LWNIEYGLFVFCEKKSAIFAHFLIWHWVVVVGDDVVVVVVIVVVVVGGGGVDVTFYSSVSMWPQGCQVQKV